MRGGLGVTTPAAPSGVGSLAAVDLRGTLPVVLGLLGGGAGVVAAAAAAAAFGAAGGVGGFFGGGGYLAAVGADVGPSVALGVGAALDVVVGWPAIRRHC
jgi:hypothetical protein